MLRGSVARVCRGALFVILLAASASSAQASATPSRECGGEQCSRAGTIRWTQPLPGIYIIDNDSRGVVPAHGEPHAAIGDQVAVYGLGTTVRAYGSLHGLPLWTVRLKNLRHGARITSARVWPGVITVGVAVPASARYGPATQTEVVLDALTGRLIRSYPSTQFGGAVAADSRRTVVVGPGAVTDYGNATGAIAWRRQTGAAPQRWQLDGHTLYVTVAASGYLGTQPVTALRKIDLRSGAEKTVSARSGSFTGTLSAALDGVILFSGSGGVTAYSGATGRLLWHLAGALPQAVDLVQRRFYLTEGTAVVGVGTRGAVKTRLRGPSGLYGERGGVAFGLDEGASGEAWGADAVSQHVIWSTSTLPWPHVFVDFGGLGGSADPRRSAIIVADCAQANLNVSPQECTKPELVVINR
ncbi:MAG: PQQ-binding-like beta-propeller repeat protein [Micromonosporaceae bacterium]